MGIIISYRSSHVSKQFGLVRLYRPARLDAKLRLLTACLTYQNGRTRTFSNYHSTIRKRHTHQIDLLPYTTDGGTETMRRLIRKDHIRNGQTLLITLTQIIMRNLFGLEVNSQSKNPVHSKFNNALYELITQHSERNILSPPKPSIHSSPLITPILRQALGQRIEFR